MGSTDWKLYEINLDVPHDATHIVFGLLLAGNGNLSADDLHLAAEHSLSLIFADPDQRKSALISVPQVLLKEENASGRFSAFAEN